MTFRCEDLVEMLCDFIDEDLAPEIREMIEHHLCGCPGCTTSVNDYMATVRVTRALGRCDHTPLPEAVETRLRAVIEIHFPAPEGRSTR